MHKFRFRCFALVIGAAIATTAQAAWSPAVPLGSPINSADHEAGGAVSPDGTMLIFASTRPGGVGWFDLWMSRYDNGWLAPENLGPTVNTEYEERNAVLSPDGQTLYFRSNRPGLGDFDLYQSDWTGTEWGPASLVPGMLNTQYGERGGSVAPNGLQMYVGCQRPAHTGAYARIYISEWDGSGWGAATPVAELDTPYDQGHCTFGSDPDEMIVTALDYPGGLGSYDIYSTVRVGGVWSPLEHLGPNINSGTVEWEPVLSPSGDQLYFTTLQAGGPGGTDIWVSNRIDDSSLPFDVGDLNCDRVLDIVDVVRMVDLVFRGATLPPCCPSMCP